VNQMTTTETATPAAPPEARSRTPKPAKVGKPGRPRREEAVPPAGVRTSRVVLRRIDPWTVLKVSVLFYLSVCIVLLTSGVLLWAAAQSVGVVENIESFMVSVGFDDFRFRPAQILRASALGGMVLVVSGTFGNVLLTVLYNLINDVVGGLKLTLAEDDSVRRRV
jgi:hypothetical protein